MPAVAEGPAVCGERYAGGEPQILRLRSDAVRLRYAQDDNSQGAETAHLKVRPVAEWNVVSGERRCEPLPRLG